MLLAFVGMPGSGKSEAVSFLAQKGYSSVRFGQVAEDGIKEMGLPLTPENEQMYREKIRQELGMAAFAIRSEDMIVKLLATHPTVVIDGLYSWEEYVYLLDKFANLKIVYVFVRPEVRYKRLGARSVRPLTAEQAKKRDFSEIEKLNKSGPIAMADFVVENNETLEAFHERIDGLIFELGLVI